MRNRTQFMLLVLLTTVIVLAALTGLASAHERRQVGSKIFVVGWFVEPAFVGEKNGVDLHVTTGIVPPEGSPPAPAGTPVAEPPPVAGVEKTLKVEIIHGAQRRTYDLRTVFRQPGRYTAHVTPTREGDYRMRFFGTVEGEQVDQTFDSADGKFNKVQPIEGTHFPVTIAGPDELTRKVESARSFGIIGTVLGVVALVLAGRASRRGGPTRV